jgi:hypothetical protein
MGGYAPYWMVWYTVREFARIIRYIQIRNCLFLTGRSRLQGLQMVPGGEPEKWPYSLVALNDHLTIASLHSPKAASQLKLRSPI